MTRRRRGACVVCRCSAYAFPHRLGGGKCSGEEWVQHQRLWGDSRECEGCIENEGHTCAPAEGRESVKVCAIYQNELHATK